MKSKLLLGFALLGMQFGCPFQGGTLAPPEVQLEDTDGDGFPELEAPEGVEPGEDIAVEIVNSLTRDQLLSIVPLDGLEGLLDLVNIVIDFDIELTYANGETVSHTESVELGPFEVRFEAICPERVTASVNVEAVAPFVGTIFAQEIPGLTLTRDGVGADGPFECGTLVSLESSFNDATNQPDISLEATDF